MEKDIIKEKHLKSILDGLNVVSNVKVSKDAMLELTINSCKILLDYINSLNEDNRLLKLCMQDTYDSANDIACEQEDKIKMYKKIIQSKDKSILKYKEALNYKIKDTIFIDKIKPILEHMKTSETIMGGEYYVIHSDFIQDLDHICRKEE